MPTSVDIEDLGTTKSEKLLAFVMLVFLLIGGIWSYQEIDDRVVRRSSSARQHRPSRRRSTRASRRSGGC